MNYKLCKQVMQSLTNEYGKEKAKKKFQRLIYEIAKETLRLRKINRILKW